MPETNKTDWRLVVQQRWPNIPSSVISGSGQFALFSKCGAYPRVRLFERWVELSDALRKECNSGQCKPESHNWRRLEPIPQRFIKRPKWAKMMEQA